MIYAGPYIEVEYEGGKPPIPADINEERQCDFTFAPTANKNTIAWLLNYTDSVGQDLDCFTNSVTNFTHNQVTREVEAFSNDPRVVFWLNLLFMSNFKATVKWGVVINQLFD